MLPRNHPFQNPLWILRRYTVRANFMRTVTPRSTVPKGALELGMVSDYGGDGDFQGLESAP